MERETECGPSASALHLLPSSALSLAASLCALCLQKVRCISQSLSAYLRWGLSTSANADKGIFFGSPQRKRQSPFIKYITYLTLSFRRASRNASLLRGRQRLLQPICFGNVFRLRVSDSVSGTLRMTGTLPRSRFRIWFDIESLYEASKHHLS